MRKTLRKYFNSCICGELWRVTVLLCSNVGFPERTFYVVNFRGVLGHFLELFYNLCVLLVLFISGK